MYSRQTPAQKADIQRKNAESAAKMAKLQAEREQAKLQQEAQDAEREKFLKRVKATREAFENGQPLPDGAQPLTAAAHYAAKAAEERTAALVARKAIRDAAKLELTNGAANTPAYILANLPPGDPLRKSAMRRAVNPEDFPE